MPGWPAKADRVLRSAMQHFGRAVTVNPLASQPGSPSFEVVAVFGNTAVTEETMSGWHTSQRPVLGIRLADFDVPPAKGDQVTVAGTLYTIFDVQPDGEGGAELLLKRA